MHWQTLDALLGAEVRAQTLHGDVHLGRALHGVPVDRQGVVTDLLYHTCQTCNGCKSADLQTEANIFLTDRVFRVDVDDPLLEGMLSLVPELPGLQLLLDRLAFPVTGYV